MAVDEPDQSSVDRRRPSYAPGDHWQRLTQATPARATWVEQTQATLADTTLAEVLNPSRMEDFRLISCCNVLYKIILKLLIDIINYIILSVVGLNQTAFILSQQILKHILLCQELLHNYHKGNKGKRVAIIELMKAFHMVKWEVILGVLRAINSPWHLIDLIAPYVTTLRFSISLNGEQVGYFASTNGLWPGNGLSLFVCLNYGDS
ncbi:uncharacterized protein [Rutidosis leptorrhynchoides]|uniref:uncharacterized protein n=1 Tax=Rutidosis leptorrhynchoides TaxID=125765 RepID=UPI003A9971D2